MDVKLFDQCVKVPCTLNAYEGKTMKLACGSCQLQHPYRPISATVDAYSKGLWRDPGMLWPNKKKSKTL